MAHHPAEGNGLVLFVSRGALDACCNVDLPQHAIGVKSENLARQRFPELVPPPASQLPPIFVHCPGTLCFKDRNSTSLINYGQSEIALNFLVSFVNETKTNPSQIGLICPYKATSELIERLRKKKPEYLPLAPMAPAATVDTYQGRENSIIVVVMCTTAAKGPGFTTNKNRLNVLLSRHVSGLVIFGDVNVLEPLVGAKRKGEDEEGGREREREREREQEGEGGRGRLLSYGGLITKESSSRLAY